MNLHVKNHLVLPFILLFVSSLACALTNQIDRLRQAQKAIETVQAVVTSIGESGIKETAQDLATKAGQSGIRQTAEAMVTGIAVEPGDIPPDIPIMPGEKYGFVGSEQVISYAISAGYPEVLVFYQREMAIQGWQEVKPGTVIGEVSADLYYKKPERQTHVVINTIPFVDQVSVVISMQ
jgi:hypothetical protein